MRQRGRSRVFALVLGVAAASTFAGSPRDAHAQPKPDKDAAARDLFAKGDAAYAEGRYEEALSAFQEAYTLSNRAQLLFNISNALERLGRYSEAVEALDKYLASGKAKDRDVVQKRLANLRKRVEDQKREEKAKEDEERAKREKEAEEKRRADLRSPELTPVPVGPPPERPGPSAFPVVLLVTGGAAIVAGGVFGIMTLSAHGEAKEGCNEGAAGNLCSEKARSALDREKTFSLVTDISLASGIVIGGIGLYLLLSGSSDRVKTSDLGPVRVVGRPGGGGVELHGSF
ncbi:MAG: tetratricopeptide repeat protein [Deltaproteobacteria bacterium]|nr:tetratricopeptide repeat protein [Deltaproteobacteria bacterium]